RKDKWGHPAGVPEPWVLIMPEEIEFEPPNPHEAAHDPAHAAHSHEAPLQDWMRVMSLTTAILAVVAAVSALRSATLVNEALLEQSKAVQSQAQASDAWAYYQAKGIKSHTSSQTADLLAPSTAPAALVQRYRDEAGRYQSEQREAERHA